VAVEAYLNFNGNAREVVNYYAEVFGVEVTNQMAFGDMPTHEAYPLPEEAKNLLMHARINVSGSNIMFSDVFPGMPFNVGNNISLSLVTDDSEEINSAFHKLKEGGSIIMELQETVWSKCYGSLTDKFGIVWQFNLGAGGV
jgi:PhnB protein